MDFKNKEKNRQEETKTHLYSHIHMTHNFSYFLHIQ